MGEPHVGDKIILPRKVPYGVQESMDSVRLVGTNAWLVRAHGLDQRDGRLLTVRLLRTIPTLAMDCVRHLFHTTRLRNMALCDKNQILLSIAYLYKAAQIASACQAGWPDMDYVIRRQNIFGKFVSEDHQSLRTLFSAFQYALGLSRKDHNLKFPTKAFQDERAIKVNSGNAPTVLVQKRGLSVVTDFAPSHGAYETAKLHHKHTRGGIRDASISKLLNENAPLYAPQLLTVMEEIEADHEIHLYFDYGLTYYYCLEIFGACLRPFQQESNCPAPPKFVAGLLQLGEMAETSHAEMHATKLFGVGKAMEDKISIRGRECLNRAEGICRRGATRADGVSS